MIKTYFKTAWRNLLKHKAGSIINLFGLTIGMSAAVFIFLWVRNELSFDNYHPQAQNIYRIKNLLSVDKTSVWTWETSPYMLGEKAKAEVPGIQLVTRLWSLTNNGPALTVNNKLVKEKAAAYIDANWFKVFHYDFLSGSADNFNRHPFSLVLTATAARKYFDTENAVGKIIHIDTLDYQVQGVIKDYPTNSSFAYDMFIPLAAKHANAKSLKDDETWSNFNYLTFVRLNPSANPQTTATRLRAIYKKNRQQDNTAVQLTALRDMHFETGLQSSQLGHGNRKVVNIFMILGIVLLVIACMNYVNLTTARATMRLKEVSVRKIVGADRKHLFGQFVLESALISLLSLGLTLLVIKLCLPLFNQVTERRFTLPLLSSPLWTILGSTFIASVLLTSIYPALLLSSFQPIAVFRGSGIFRVKNTSLRKTLVVCQFTISIVLIVATIVIYRQMQFIQQQNDQYDKSQVLTFSIPWSDAMKMKKPQREGLAKNIEQALRSQSGIENVSIMNGGSVLDYRSFSSGGTDWDGRVEGFDPGITFFSADTNFRKILNLQLADGRWFIPNSVADAHNAILNETAVRELGIRKPVIGQRFVARGDTGVVIGVVKDFYYKNMHEKIDPVVIKNDAEYAFSFLVKTVPGKASAAQAAIAQVYKAQVPGSIFEYKFLDDEFDHLYREDHKTASLIWTFSLLAIFISCLGLYGLAAFSAERRHKEISIRKVLGASMHSIVSLLSKEFVYLVLAALLLATPLAWWAMNNWLQDFAYRIHIQWWMFVLAGVLAVAITLVTVGFQAIKAALMNPVKNLRSE
ncbi:ABC transporter permease [Paraflavitalea soli]|uniref:ABC transporter permease n=1 Tax=Paraflavitalea soli TaxID=2315862 RepID=A0A3B7MWY5_9BACT|nr:ABC transporter permease [Paraflavitalea soli]AXY74881.1 ABC transporter permease [Paraflavitalea soli]